MIVLDTETTGLPKGETDDPKRQPGIVQIAILRLDEEWNELESYCMYINPEMPVEADALAVHKITPEMYASAPTFGEAVVGVAEFCLGEAIWVGYSNEFDRKVLFANLCRYGWQMKFPWPYRDVDVMKWAKDVANIAGKRDLKFPSLMELHEGLFGEKFAGAHGALEDCRATARCGEHLWKEGIICL